MHLLVDLNIMRRKKMAGCIFFIFCGFTMCRLLVAVKLVLRKILILFGMTTTKMLSSYTVQTLACTVHCVFCKTCMFYKKTWSCVRKGIRCAIIVIKIGALTKIIRILKETGDFTTSNDDHLCDTRGRGDVLLQSIVEIAEEE